MMVNTVKCIDLNQSSLHFLNAYVYILMCIYVYIIISCYLIFSQMKTNIILGIEIKYLNATWAISSLSDIF